MKVLQPAGWMRPRGYSNGLAARGTLVAVAGQIGWDANGKMAGSDLLSQVRQALANVVAVLHEAGAGPQHIVRMTWYLTDRADYLAQAREIGSAYRELMTHQGHVHYPAMTAVEVSALIEADAKVEIEVTAVIPDEKELP